VVASSTTPPDIRRIILRNMSETERNRNVQYINNYVKRPESVTVIQNPSATKVYTFQDPQQPPYRDNYECTNTI
jgi:hypothetical protein